MKIRIVKPDANVVLNDWGHSYNYSDTVEVDLNDFPRWLMDSVDDEPFDEESKDNLENISEVMGHFIEMKTKEIQNG